MVESKENLEKSRDSYLRMVKRYNEDIECMEKTGKDTDGRKVTKGDIEASKEMRTQRLERVNKINTDIQKYYGGK